MFRTQFEELVARAKTWVWSAFWISFAYFIDLLLASMGTANLPTVTTTLWGMFPTPLVINTAVPVGLFLNQVSKYLHNYREDKIL